MSCRTQDEHFHLYLMDNYDCDDENFWFQDSFCIEKTLSNNLREFLENPPPDEIKSLRLTGLKELDEIQTPSPETLKLWTDFVVFWYKKLGTLEVDYFDKFFSPGESFVNQLLSFLIYLERFVCYKIVEKYNANPSITDLPQRLFFLKHLQVVEFSMKNKTLLQF